MNCFRVSIGLGAMILDLELRGMLDDTLVMVLTEHGRTPKISETVRGATARALVADLLQFVCRPEESPRNGGGSSDRIGGFVKDRPVSPKESCAPCIT